MTLASACDSVRAIPEVHLIFIFDRFWARQERGVLLGYDFDLPAV